MARLCLGQHNHDRPASLSRWPSNVGVPVITRVFHTLVLRNNSTLVTNSVTRLGDFLKLPVTKFSYKSSPNIWAYLEKCHFLSKNYWTTREEFVLLCVTTCGHTGYKWISRSIRTSCIWLFISEEMQVFCWFYLLWTSLNCHCSLFDIDPFYHFNYSILSVILCFINHSSI